jgi:hypothetical protein
MLGRILTKDDMRKWHIIVLDWCWMCKMSGESISHLLPYCEIDSALWNSIFSLFGLHWVMLRRVVTSSLVGKGSMVALIVLRCWYCPAWCGVSGKKEMTGVLKTKRLWEDNGGIKTFYQWTTTLDCFHFSGFCVFLDFFFFSFWLRVSLVYLLYTWVAPLRFLMKFIYLTKKEEEEIGLVSLDIWWIKILGAKKS